MYLDMYNPFHFHSTVLKIEFKSFSCCCFEQIYLFLALHFTVSS